MTKEHTLRNVKFEDISSSMIKQTGFYEETLYVIFTNDALYKLTDFPREEYDNLVGADKVGSYYHKHVKDQYTTYLWNETTEEWELR